MIGPVTKRAWDVDFDSWHNLMCDWGRGLLTDEEFDRFIIGIIYQWKRYE